MEGEENLKSLQRFCRRCGIQLSEIGIRTKPKLYCPICKDISKVETIKTWKIAHGQ